MKKMILMGAMTSIVLATAACSKTKEDTTETVAGVVGEELVMPQEGTDTSVVADGVAIMVDTNK
ncbi:MAG: hypothetical protein NC402_06445 [Prevotella sp.]|nr:hypothetical protein [Prevotella sp.]MCM1075340.1 hypothetical protein [Ruminococcus sp.]